MGNPKEEVTTMIKYIPGNEWAPGDAVAKKAAGVCQKFLPLLDFSVRWGSGKLGGTTLVLDLGWFKRSWNNFAERKGGYYQIGVNRICWLPPHCPRDRWEKLGLEIHAPKPVGENLLAIGQVAHDAQHGLSYTEMHEWFLGKASGGYRYRPHPQGDEGKPQRSLEEDLDWADMVLTYNSTVGLEALRLGIPVICSNNCFYRELCNQPCPSHGKRLNFFSRVAYAQWSEEEIERGDFIPTYYDYLK
jgi:hypothetical protein